MSPHRILLADDNPDHVLLTLDALESLPGETEVRVVHDGREALEVLAGEWKPELLLLDVQMPYLDGFEVLARIRADDRLADVCVVMLTTSSDERDIGRSEGLGSNSFLTKPVGADALRAFLLEVPT